MGILVHRARRSGAAACARRLLAPILLIVATACTAGEVAEPARSPSAGPWRGGTLRVVTWLPGVTELDPATSYWWGTHHELYRCCLLRTLFSYNGLALADGGAEPLPDLAAGPPDVSSDGLTWTFEIRPNLHYAPPYEGTEIVAADIVRALERIPPPGTACGSTASTTRSSTATTSSGPGRPPGSRGSRPPIRTR